MVFDYLPLIAFLIILADKIIKERYETKRAAGTKYTKASDSTLY